jgi:predicted transposase/invertase (TIGR01784 family)
VYTIPTYDAAFKWVLSSNEVRPSFFRAFIPDMAIQSSERIDEHMNPLQNLQLLRHFLHDKGTSNTVKSLSSSGAYVVRGRAGQKRSHTKDDSATTFLYEIVGWFEEIRDAFPQPRYDGKMDFACQLSSGEYALVEMQVIPEDYWDRRALAYVAAFYGNQLNKGGQWKHIRKVIGVNILGGGKENKVAWSDFPGQHMRHYKLEDQLNDKGRFIDGIELIQYSIMHAPATVDRERNDWITFFKRAHEMTEDEVQAQITTPAVLIAFELSKFSKLPAEVRASYEAEDREYDRYSQHTTEQISKGEKSAKIEVARNMIKRGRPLNEILEDTGLSPEDLKGP